MSDGFLTRKKTILVALNSDTPDKSPKGYVDEPLLPLIVLINNHQDYVTTSSCSGRICTYLEGLESEAEEGETETSIDTKEKDQEDKEDDDEETSKGYEENTSLAAVEAAKRAKGGQWLYVSHDPVVFPSQSLEHPRWIVDTLFGPEAHRVVLMEDQQKEGMRTIDMARSQLVYFKFEPMVHLVILFVHHIICFIFLIRKHLTQKKKKKLDPTYRSSNTSRRKDIPESLSLLRISQLGNLAVCKTHHARHPFNSQTRRPHRLHTFFHHFLFHDHRNNNRRRKDLLDGLIIIPPRPDRSEQRQVQDECRTNGPFRRTANKAFA